MISFKDRTFCASPQCKNDCGRMWTEELQKEYDLVNGPDGFDGVLGVSYGYFCGEPSDD